MNQDIEAYLDDSLDPAARSEFEAQLSYNEALRKAVAEARRMREDLSWLAVEQGIKQGEQAFWEKRAARKHRNIWFWAAGILMLLLFGGIFWWQWKNTLPPVSQEQSPMQPGNQNSLPTAPDSTIQRMPATPENTDSLQKIARTTLINRLFAENFKPYKDETLEPTLRGDAEPLPSEKFQQLYWDGKYREALAQFRALPATAQTNDNMLFLKAESLLAVGRVGEAVPEFEAILERDKSRYMEVAAWHLALAYMKTGKSDQAKTQLQKISRSASKWREEAAALLKSIQ